MLFFLVACGGPSEETLVDELRVLAMVVEPPEIQPGETATVTTWIADPSGAGADAMSWSCTSLGTGCLEAERADQGTTVAQPAGPTLVATVTAPVELAGVVADGETVLPSFLWGLACAEGTCDVIDLAAASPAVGSEDAADLSTFLADPYGAISDYPIDGTSLALQSLGVSQRPTPIANPVILTAAAPIQATTDEQVAVVLSVDGAAEAWGYTTAGGFEMPSYAVEEGTVTLDWIAPAEAGSATLWVVVNGPDGGSAVWTTTASIE